MSKHLKKFILIACIFFISCTTSSTDTGSNDSNVSLNNTNIQLQEAKALLLQKSSSIYSTSSGNVTTNFLQLLKDGTLTPVISSSESVGVTYIDRSPAGDLHIMFSNSVIVNSEDCRWIVIKPDNQVSCVDSSIINFTYIKIQEQYARYRFATTENGTSSSEPSAGYLSQLEFDDSGNATYAVTEASGTSNVIYHWDRASGIVSTTLDAASLNLHVSHFFLSSDGSLIMSGDISGSNNPLFHFIPSSKTLNETCITSLESFFMSASSDLYIHGLGNCDGHTSTTNEVWKGVLTDGNFTFTALGDNVDGYSFFEDSVGNVYLGTTLINNGAFDEITISGIKNADLSQVSRDYLYETGTDASGNHVFIRKHLLGEREETDLLNGANLLVQQFDVAKNGDVYFGALDLSTTTVKLYLYNNTTNELQQFDNLSSDLSQIISL